MKCFNSLLIMARIVTLPGYWCHGIGLQNSSIMWCQGTSLFTFNALSSLMRRVNNWKFQIFVLRRQQKQQNLICPFAPLNSYKLFDQIDWLHTLSLHCMACLQQTKEEKKINFFGLKNKSNHWKITTTTTTTTMANCIVLFVFVFSNLPHMQRTYAL